MADISVVATAVAPGSGAEYLYGVFGATTTAGQTAYLVTSTSTSPPTFGLCDANGSDEVATLAGIFMTGGAAGQPCTVLRSGNFNPGVAVTVGELYVTTATAGGIALADDLATGWKTAVVGVATTTSNIVYWGKSSLVALLA